MSAAAVAVRASDQPAYNEDVIRLFMIATMFWGVDRVHGGQRSSPSSSPSRRSTSDLEWTTFGRLRPLHTSAVIFAFGGNALIATSFYVVQRTCRATLFGGPLARELRVLGLPAVHRDGGDWAMSWASARAASMPSPNGMSTSG